MELVFTFRAPNTQPGSDDVTTIKIWESTDHENFSLVHTDTLLPTATSYTYDDGYADRSYRISFVDDDLLESPLSDIMYGGTIVSEPELTGWSTVNTQLTEMLTLINARPTRREITNSMAAMGEMIQDLANKVNTQDNQIQSLKRAIDSQARTIAALS